MQEGSPDQPRDEHGRFATSGGNAEAIGRITNHSGFGATYSAHGQKQQKTGYMVAEAAYERIVDAPSEQAVIDHIRQYTADYKTELSRHDVFLGTWLAKGKMFIDNSHNIQDRTTALKFADANGQYAVYNMGIKDTENTRQDGSRPSADNPAPLTEADAEQTTHKMFFDPSMSAEEIGHIIWASRDGKGNSISPRQPKK